MNDNLDNNITDRTRNRRNAMARRNTTLNLDEIGMESNTSMMPLPKTIINYPNKGYSSRQQEKMLNMALEKGKGLGGKRRKTKRRKSRRRKNNTKSKKYKY